MKKSIRELKNCGLRKLSGGLKNFVAEEFRASILMKPLEQLAKLSSNESRLSSRSACRNDRAGAVLRSEGLGSDFLNAIEETTQNIERFPEPGRIDRENIR